MKVMEPRWGEITVKKQGKGKNQFDKTKSFSARQTPTNYTINQFIEILQLATNLTEKIKFEDLKARLGKL